MSAPTTETTAALWAAAAEVEEALARLVRAGKLAQSTADLRELGLTAAANEARVCALDALAELQSRAGALARELAAWNPYRAEVSR